jgi:hypothetical protein
MAGGRLTRRARSAAPARPATRRATGPAAAPPPSAVGGSPAAPAAAEFVAPAHTRDWSADPEIVRTVDGRRIVRASVGRRRGAKPEQDAPAVDHSDWLYSAWEPVLPGQAYSEVRDALDGEAGPWGRVDTWRSPTPITDYTTYCFRARGEIRLWSRPRAAFEYVAQVEVEEFKRKQKRGEP